MPHKNQADYSKIISYTAIISVTLLAVRIFITGHITYAFLIWNLILAAVPFYVVRCFRYQSDCAQQPRASQNPIVLISILSLWLLFLPNAPYILTDFVHLQTEGNLYFFLDVAILSSFSLSGMLMAISSLNSVMLHLKAQKWINTRAASILFKITIVLLCSLGVYLGRILRWNSWNILNRPRGLASDLLQLFLYPLDHLEPWTFIIVYSGLLIILSLTIEKLIHATSKS
jgi:uncharacterized membrane protein